MVLEPTEIDGVVVVEPERHVDERGFFARTFDAEHFAEHGLETAVVQCSTSFNLRAGTVRGMHWQAEPHGEAKLVRCTRGAVFDVAVDVRPGSPTFRRWCGVELSAENGRALFVPIGCAHGFQTLCDDSEVLYQISAPYVPRAACGFRWDDPRIGIRWPEAPSGGRTLSERDATYPDLPE